FSALVDRAIGQRDRLPQFLTRSRQQQAGARRALGDERIGGLAEAGQQRTASTLVVVLAAEVQAQLRVAVPGLVVQWAIFEGLRPGQTTLLELAARRQGLRQEPGGQGGLRIQG